MNIDYEENRTGTGRPECYLEVPMDETFYKATVKALKWRPAVDGAAGIACIEHVAIESLLRMCRVADPSKVSRGFMTRCMDVAKIRLALDELELHDLFELQDGEDDFHEFKDESELQFRCDKLITENMAKPALLFSDDSDYDYYDDVSDARLQYMEDHATMARLLELTNDHTLYVENWPRSSGRERRMATGWAVTRNWKASHSPTAPTFPSCCEW